MSLEKFLRTHAAKFERKPWLPIEEQVEEAFEEAVREAAEQAERGSKEQAYDEGFEEGQEEGREEFVQDVLTVLNSDDMNDTEKLTAIRGIVK